MVSGWTNAFIFTTNRVIFRTNSAIFKINPVIPGTYPVMLKGFYGEKSYHILVKRPKNMMNIFFYHLFNSGEAAGGGNTKK